MFNSNKNNTNKNNKTKPKLTVTKAIRKFLISWDIKLDNNTKVYYAWDKKRQPKWTSDGSKPIHSYIGVDYIPELREWHISYIVGEAWRYYGVIDDITGSISLESVS